MNIWLSRNEHRRLLAQIIDAICKHKVSQRDGERLEECQFVLKNDRSCHMAEAGLPNAATQIPGCG